jgi:ABC-type cobalamin/Fe3+-siderophores transport system ATPase subunit
VAQQVKVLLLDEPNAFLDIPRSHALFRMLRDLAENRNMGIVVSTHSVEYAERYCKRIMVIDKGAIRVAAAAEARSSGLLDWTEA